MATVDSEGLVHAGTTDGTATITATNAGISGMTEATLQIDLTVPLAPLLDARAGAVREATIEGPDGRAILYVYRKTSRP